MFIILVTRIIRIGMDCLAVLDVPKISQAGLDVAVLIFLDQGSRMSDPKLSSVAHVSEVCYSESYS